ncbi:hypothetical protein D3C80_1818320 [compost metagenome]
MAENLPVLAAVNVDRVDKADAFSQTVHALDNLVGAVTRVGCTGLIKKIVVGIVILYLIQHTELHITKCPFHGICNVAG